MSEENRSIDVIWHHIPSWVGDLRFKKLESLQNNLRTSHSKTPLDRLHLQLLLGTIFTRLLSSYYELLQMDEHYGRANVWAWFTAEVKQEDYDHYMLCANSFESFVTKLYSSIQTMARLVFVVYNMKLKPDRIYFHNVKEQLLKHHSSEPITQSFVQSSQSEWFKYLSRMRVRIEHSEAEMFIADFMHDKIYLQPNPELSPLKQEKAPKYELKKTCNDIFDNASKFLEESAKCVNDYLFR